MYETTMTMVGRVATAVSQVTFDDGGVKATFRLASTERRFDRGLQQWVDGSRLFLTVICWRVLAERVLATLGVGDPVIVTGKLRAREYEKDGRTQAVIELDAASIGPDLTRCAAVVARRGTRPSAERDRPTGTSAADGMSPASWATAAVATSAEATAAEPSHTDHAAGTAEWNGGPLVQEYLDPDDQAPTGEPWLDEAAVRA